MRSAFTLLEVLLALTIFALVTVGVLLTFRTAVRTYERSEQTMATAQAIRAVGDRLGRDIRATFLVTETSYGIRLHPTEREAPMVRIYGDGANESVQNHILSLQEEGIPYRIVSLDGQALEQARHDGNLQAELQFTVTDGGERDTVSLVRRLRRVSGRRVHPWGLVRLTYSVKGGQLIRREEQAFQMHEIPALGEDDNIDDTFERLAQELAERREASATEQVFLDGVEVFDLRCVHWADDAWVVTGEAWDSREKRHRNPLDESPVEFGDPNFAALTSTVEGMPEDGLPAALEAVLGIRDPVSGRLRHTRVVIPIHGAQETWVPPDPTLMRAAGGRRAGERRGP